MTMVMAASSVPISRKAWDRWRRATVTAGRRAGPRPLADPCALHLVLPLQGEDVGDFAKGQAQGDDLGLSGLVGQLADVEHARRGGLLHPQLLAVAAVGGAV